MSTCLTILNASGKLSPLRDRIERTYATSIATVARLLPIADIDVVIMAGKRVIPELGLAGFAPASDLLYITLDPDNENLLPKFDEEFPATLGHELHHCLRHGGPGYGNTLREAIVSEGLACHFETELRNGDAPFYGVHLDSHTLEFVASNGAGTRHTKLRPRGLVLWFGREKHSETRGLLHGLPGSR